MTRGRYRRDGWRCSIFVAAGMLFVLAFASPVLADAFDDAVAEINKALEANANDVPEESLNTCRSMLKTAVLLRKMGHTDRAIRRIKSCWKFLGVSEFDSSAKDPGPAWLA